MMTQRERFQYQDELRAQREQPPMIRVVFDARSGGKRGRRGRKIIREIEPGSANAERIIGRLLGRKNAAILSGAR